MEKEARVSQLSFLKNDYVLEHYVKSTKTFATMYLIVSPIIKILMILSIVLAFIYSYFILFSLLGLIAIQIIINVLKGKYNYTIKYIYYDYQLKIIKYSNNKEEVLTNINTKDIISNEFIDNIPENAILYFDKKEIDTTSDSLLNIKTENDSFIILSDKYLYGLINYKED